MYCGGELLGAGTVQEVASPAAKAPEAPALNPAAVALLQQLDTRAKTRSAKAQKPGLFQRFRDKGGEAEKAKAAPAVEPRAKKKIASSTITLLADAPAAPTTYAEALVRGGGPFGNRDSAARVILFPLPEYKLKIAWLKHRIANTVGIDLYTAVQALQRDVPRSLRAFDDPDEAETVVAHLREGGLHAAVLHRSRVEAWEGFDEATAVTEQDDEAVGFRLEGGGEESVPRREIRIACLGRVDADPLEISSGNLGRRGGTYTALDLLIEGRDKPLRLRSDLFDFRSAGDGIGISALVNLKYIAAQLGPNGAPVTLDERFKRVPHFPALARSADAGEQARFLRRELELAEYLLVLELSLA